MRNLTLLTDLYQLTMGYGFYRNNKHEEEVVFDLFFRKNALITYSIAAGLEQAVEKWKTDDTALDGFIQVDENEDAPWK